MDEILARARHELAEKIRFLKELNIAREGLERHLMANKLGDVLEKNLRTLEDKIGDELTKGVCGLGRAGLEKKQLEQSVIEACKVVTLKGEPLKSEDYSLKLRPIWSREGTGPGEIKRPMQIAIDDTTQNMFVADVSANIIQVFNEEGNHLYEIPTAEAPIGIALTD